MLFFFLSMFGLFLISFYYSIICRFFVEGLLLQMGAPPPPPPLPILLSIPLLSMAAPPPPPLPLPLSIPLLSVSTLNLPLPLTTTPVPPINSTTTTPRLPCSPRLLKLQHQLAPPSPAAPALQTALASSPNPEATLTWMHPRT